MAQSKVKTDQIDVVGPGNIATDVETAQMISGSFAQFEWQQPVIVIQNTPPESPVKGDRYIVGTAPGGAWYEHNNEIAYYDGSVWQFDIPVEGWICYVESIGGCFGYIGAKWILITGFGSNLYVNYDGVNVKSYIYFYANGSPTGKRFEWDPGEGVAGSFYLNGHLSLDANAHIIGYISIDYDIYLGVGTTALDKVIYANNGDVNLPVLRYSESGNKWQFSNDGLTFNDMRGSGGADIFCKGGTLYNSAGISNAALNIIVWRAPFACTVTNVRGYRVGGTGATVNARRNGSLNHLASALSLTSADTWMNGGAVQNTAFAAGDKLEIRIVSTAGTVTQLAIQIDFVKP